MGTASNVIVGSATLSIKNPYDGSYAESGYTVEGVTLNYSADVNDLIPDEETVAIKRTIIKEEITITCQMHEATLANLAAALAGADDDTTRTIKLGNKTLQEIAVKIVGTSPNASYTVRTIECTKGNPVGAVGIAYKKGESNMIPFEFKALVPDSGDVCTIVDSAT